MSQINYVLFGILPLILKPLFMNRILLLTLFLFFINATPKRTYGQCIAEAGIDTVICSGDTTSYVMGGSPTVVGGLPPYSYNWSFTFTSVIGKTYTASDFLDDTTKANPKIINPWTDKQVVHLKVTDGAGNSCEDDIEIDYYKWIHTLDEGEAYISLGDSVELWENLGSKYPVASYLWTPVIGLSDSTVARPWSKPDSSTKYTVKVTDIYGCHAYDHFNVLVYPVGLIGTQVKETRTYVYPNPTDGPYRINLGQEHYAVSIIIRNLENQVISHEEHNWVESIQGQIEGESGIYTIELRSIGLQSTFFRVIKK